MCYNCGCHRPTDDMGDPNNVTEATLTSMSQKNGLTLEQFKQKLFLLLKQKLADKIEVTFPQDVEEMFQKGAKAWGQTVDDAKTKTYELLKKQFENAPSAT